MSRPATLSCDEVRDDMAVWALEGGEPWPGIAEHCESCAHCRVIGDEYAAVVGALPFALAAPAAPSPRVRDAIRARLAPPRPAGRSRWVFPASIAAAVVIAVVAGSAGYLAGRDGGGDFVAVVPERAERVQLQRAEAAGTNSGGVLLVDHQGNSALLNAWGLPQLPEGEVYQFWFMHRDGTRISAFTFRPDSDGRSVRIATLPEDFESIGGVWLTKEQDGGSPTPEGPNVLITRWQ
ncbi:MAG: anti-sigma factor [Dehalococcoidia bacterium]|nr:anti-sigma factor [Dehalococcoidia bacterium]